MPGRACGCRRIDFSFCWAPLARSALFVKELSVISLAFAAVCATLAMLIPLARASSVQLLPLDLSEAISFTLPLLPRAMVLIRAELAEAELESVLLRLQIPLAHSRGAGDGRNYIRRYFRRERPRRCPAPCSPRAHNRPRAGCRGRRNPDRPITALRPCGHAGAGSGAPAEAVAEGCEAGMARPPTNPAETRRTGTSRFHGEKVLPEKAEDGQAPFS